MALSMARTQPLRVLGPLRSINGRFRGFEREDGAVLILTAFIFVALLGIAALVVDIAMIHQARLRAQATADASVLAAAFDLDDVGAATAAAKEYAARNYDVADGDWTSCVDSEALAVATTVPCISVNDADPHTFIRVRIPDRTVPSFFAAVLGRDGVTVSASATAEVEFAVISEGGPAANPGNDPFADTVRTLASVGIAGYAPCDPIPDWSAGSEQDKNKWTEFIFVFEHLPVPPATVGGTATICGSTRTGGNKEAWIADAGGSDIENPTGFLAHVSCSDVFFDGWTSHDPPNGPVQGIDTEWRMLRYRMDRFQGVGENPLNKKCGKSFTPISSAPPVIQIQSTIRLSD